MTHPSLQRRFLRLRPTVAEPEQLGESKRCQEPGCEKRASDKPYCAKHITRLAYVSALARDIERREACLRRVRGGGNVRVRDDPNAQEILGMLTLNVPMTIDRIARETKFGKSVVAKYVSALKRAGLVRTSKTKRNKIVVQACVGPTR